MTPYTFNMRENLQRLPSSRYLKNLHNYRYPTRLPEEERLLTSTWPCCWEILRQFESLASHGCSFPSTSTAYVRPNLASGIIVKINQPPLSEIPSHSSLIFQIIVGEEFSEAQRIMNEVPQGSYLSHLHFNILYADIPLYNKLIALLWAWFSFLCFGITQKCRNSEKRK